MDFLKKRQMAIAIFVVVVILFGLFGCHRSLSKASQKVEELFFEPSALREDYYSCPADQLEYALRYANSLLAVINGQLPQALYDDLYTSRQALIAALEARDISDIYAAQTALTQAVQAADREALALDIREDLVDFCDLVADYDSAVFQATNSGYNDYVDAFMADVANQFPARLLRGITHTEMPEKYE